MSRELKQLLNILNYPKKKFPLLGMKHVIKYTVITPSKIKQKIP